MWIEVPGHVYHLQQQRSQGGVAEGAWHTLRFVCREPGREQDGVQTQEVLRALIDRTYHCDSCLPSDLNAQIIHHLRMALVYHEMRALERKAIKGGYTPETVPVGDDGHFDLLVGDLPLKSAPRREFPWKPDPGVCKYKP